ncbi:MAG: serine/threonine protein kinase [Microcystaceae cyanobacterium]
MTDYPDFSNYGYQIISELGHNRAGGRVTYLAMEINTQNNVVVKQFFFAQTTSKWSDYDSYQREIDILKALDHPNIPKYLDSFQTPTGFCMIQEYKKAPSLAVSRNWTPQQIKQIAISILDILKYLQGKIPPIIHRDLKPENILVDEQLNVSLVDFGFARMGGGEVAVSSVVKGTLGFMPPEQMFNRELTPASDLYSLGATLICLLTNTLSTHVGNLMDENGKIDFKAKVPHLSDEFINWLEKCIHPHYQQRFANADQAFNALIPIKVLRPKQLSNRSQRIIKATVSGVVLLGIGITGWHFLVPKPQEEMSRLSYIEDLASQSDQVQGTVTYNQSNNDYTFNIMLNQVSEKLDPLTCQVINAQGMPLAYGEAKTEFIAEQQKIKAQCIYQKNSDNGNVNDLRFQLFLGEQKIVENRLN